MKSIICHLLFALALALTGCKCGGTDSTLIVYHYDERGNLSFLTDASGKVIAEASHAPFGRRLAGSTEPYGYAGMEWDEDTGLYDFHGRQLDPMIGRFISPDPVAVMDPMAGFENSQRLNPYAYALDNPWRYIDRNGRQAEEEEEVRAEPGSEPSANAYWGGRLRSAEDRIAAAGRQIPSRIEPPGPPTRAEAEAMERYANELTPPRSAPNPARMEPSIPEGVRAPPPAPAVAAKPNWPPNDGFLSTPRAERLPPGTIIDRYGGSPGSQFFAPVGTPLEARSLNSFVASQPLRTFLVKEPGLDVLSGEAAPWFGQPGLGTQYRSETPLADLLRSGALLELTPAEPSMDAAPAADQQAGGTSQ